MLLVGADAGKGTEGQCPDSKGRHMTHWRKKCFANTVHGKGSFVACANQRDAVGGEAVRKWKRNWSVPSGRKKPRHEQG